MVMTLKTLADVRELLDAAARGGDTVNVVVPLRMVLSMEGVECRPK
jgi:hypothetical protein